LKLVAIVGSPRLKGNTNYLVDQALKEATRLGAKTEKLVLSQYKVKPCLGHANCASFQSCRQKDDTGWILDKFREADGVILATPVYYYNVSAQMKAFIDRNYFLYKHDQKYKAGVVGIIIVAEQEGIEDTLHTLKQFIDEFDVDRDAIFTVCGYADQPGDVKNNLPLVEKARKLGRQMVEALKSGS
jgi:multimeric flavodoxin WrbA